MFKKTAIAALVLGFSGAASAAMYAPAPAPACSAGNVTVPCERSAWGLGVDALYLRAQDHQFDGVNNYRARYGWGFRLEGSYYWGTGNDATLVWSHYNRSNGVRVGRMLNTKFDIVDFEVGQHVDVGEAVDVRFHGGLEYANLSENGFGGPLIVARAAGRTKAFGPRVGLGASYDFGNGFGLFANAGFASLAGKMRLNAPAAAVGTFWGQVFHVDEKIGAQYTHAMAQGDLTLRVGYQANDFHHGNVNGSTFGDAAWHGAFVGLKWVGNA